MSAMYAEMYVTLFDLRFESEVQLRANKTKKLTFQSAWERKCFYDNSMIQEFWKGVNEMSL